MFKIVKFAILLLFFIIFSHSLQAYQLREDEVRELETLDNEICLSRGHNLSDEFSIKLYWDCRLQLIDDRINRSINLKGKNRFYITELKRIRAVIRNVISKIDSNFMDKIEYYTGIQNRSVELRGKDSYYYNLLTFLKYDYTIMSVNSKMEIQNIIETRGKLKKKKEADSLKRSLERFPECIRYDVHTPEFKHCIDFKKQVEECKEVVLKKLDDRDTKSKFDCKKQSIDKYPDHMALYNDEYLELKNMKLDEFNINRKKQIERERRILELNNLMSGPRLSNAQLIDLRKYEERKCLMDRELENNLFRLTISGECENIIKNEV
ncbi:MAG: hypothetical protein LBS34_01045 [Rickettsiales bacterium]|jgi:hypothetical protein|nr:hypothetical protein [Rickettsiales bacterium]